MADVPKEIQDIQTRIADEQAKIAAAETKAEPYIQKFCADPHQVARKAITAAITAGISTVVLKTGVHLDPVVSGFISSTVGGIATYLVPNA